MLIPHASTTPGQHRLHESRTTDFQMFLSRDRGRSCCIRCERTQPHTKFVEKHFLHTNLRVFLAVWNVSFGVVEQRLLGASGLSVLILVSITALIHRLAGAAPKT